MGASCDPRLSGHSRADELWCGDVVTAVATISVSLFTGLLVDHVRNKLV